MKPMRPTRPPSPRDSIARLKSRTMVRAKRDQSAVSKHLNARNAALVRHKGLAILKSRT